MCKPIFTYLALGCGVQSAEARFRRTLAEMIAEGELPVVDAAIFADTGDEPDYVYTQRDYLVERLAGVGVPVITVSAGNLIADILSADARFAAMPVFTRQVDGRVGQMQRQCTSEYKIRPLERWIRQRLLALGLAKTIARRVMREKGSRTIEAIYVNRNVQVEAWLGLSIDEAERLKPNPVPWITNRWPLVERHFTRHACKTWLKKRGLPIPRKSSCRVCPFHADAYWREMRADHPEDWAHAVAFDAALRDGSLRLSATARGALFLHRTCIRLSEIDLSTPQERGQRDFFDACDEGYCGV